MPKTRIQLVLAVAALATATCALPAAAVELPCSTAKFIIPWAAGGDTDIIMRGIAEAANKAGAKPQLQVINIAGQGGTKGAKDVKDAAPDGCTLLALHDSAITSYLTGRADFTWDAFEPVALIAHTPAIIGVSKQAPFNSLKELIEIAKKAPGTINTGATLGSTSHFFFILLEDKANIRLKYVPYEGTRERMTALLANNIQLGELNIIAAKQYLKEGSLRSFGIATEKRDPAIPDLPTLKEQGVDLQYAVNRGVVLPKGTKPEVIAYWEGVFAKAAKDPALVKLLESQGTDVRYLNSKDYRAFWEKSFAENKTAAVNLGIYKGN
ncbi:MAG TPA: tripartite tricarboxylate transporter substrate binding protein [Hyphomicrobiaceae bacterium]|nr:tripartite tricarboxylate transporter substrate binding protein [Hyphomicrobiaceae bacterium]